MTHTKLGRRFLTDENPVFWLRCALLVVATFSFIRAIRYGLGGERLPMAIEVVSSFVPIWVWGLAWGAAGICAVACIPKAWPGGSLPTICLSIGFAVGYTISWVTSYNGGDPINHADYVGANNYWTVPLVLICGYFGFTRALKKPAPPEEKP